MSKTQLYGTVEETYDNNVNLTPINKLDDFITSVSLGLRFSTLPQSEKTGEFLLPSPTIVKETRYGIYLDLRPGYVFYGKNTQQDYFSLNGNLDTWYTWYNKLTFRVRDYAIRSQEPLEQNLSAGALPGQILLGSQTGRPIYFRNVVQPSLEYQFGREDLIFINYLNNVYKNQSPAFQDSTENYINPGITYWFNIRHGVSLEYGLDLGDFEHHPAMTGNLGKGRYVYRFNPNTLIFGEYTFQSRVFEKPGAGVAITFLDYYINQPAIGFEHKFSGTLSLRGKFGYFWQTVQGASNQTGPVYDVVITQRAGRTIYSLGVQGGYAEDFFTARNLGFAKYNQAIGTITHQLMEKLSVTLSGRYQRPEFPGGNDVKRVDNIWGVTAGASYRFLRWLTLGLDFSYAEDHSNQPLNNYSDFQGIFRITATY